MKYSVTLMSVLVLLAGACDSKETSQKMKLNHLQVIGSHNSYKKAIEPPLMKLLLVEDPRAIELDYSHVPLKEHLDMGHWMQFGEKSFLFWIPAQSSLRNT